MSAQYELVIGSRNYSSWSLRPWLLMKSFDIAFTEILIRLRRPESGAELLRHSPSGKVPLLKCDGLLVWDSLAIIEFLAEQYPNKPIWPADPAIRAHARCVAAEMHSGFEALRSEMPMNVISILDFPAASGKALADITRIVAIWKDCRQRHAAAGPFLFGQFSAADAMFAPVATRFRTYQVDLPRFGDDGSAAAYRDLMMDHPSMQEWADACTLED